MTGNGCGEGIQIDHCYGTVTSLGFEKVVSLVFISVIKIIL